MSTESDGPGQFISLPSGGGALHGLGEKFAPDLHTGTANFTVPLTLPPGRNALQPQLGFVYSTGGGNGAFGLGWSLSVPGVSRKTSKGVPRYDGTDTFLLSGAEDLVRVAAPAPGVARYRPRTEGLFARIDHHREPGNDYWEVRSRDGLVSRYGTPGAAGADPAVVADPADRARVYAWSLTRTFDPFGNRMEYEYRRDPGQDGSRRWDQLYLRRIRYADYTDAGGAERFLVSVTLEYGDAERPDPFSEHRGGFEVRTRWRGNRIEVRTHADVDRLVRTYHLDYLDERPEQRHRLPLNGVSLLSRIRIVGHDGDHAEELAPLEFAYTGFEPRKREFFPLRGADLPPRSLALPDFELVDLFGHGLPDVLEMNGTVRFWRNRGGGRFDLPRPMATAPAGVRLADPGVQLLDVDGDGRTDLVVLGAPLRGFYPLQFGGGWDRRSFQPFRAAPSFDLEDPEVRLVDLDGDGLTDVVRSGSRLECFFQEPGRGWSRTRWVERGALRDLPPVSFSDPRVRWADMTGDGLQDLVLVHDGNIEYWPNLGHGDWGPRVSMRHSPRFPHGYDPRLILLGDVDGDGATDLVFVDHRRVLLYMNRSGNGWSEPVEIRGTPPVSDLDAVRLVDLLGNGVGGLLWSTHAGRAGEGLYFLDFTGGVKPYLLSEMDNRMGSVSRVEYAPSTRHFLADEQRPATRWQTPLPFPVQVVARVEVIDALSGGKLSTEYRYHHGYWDGAEREFRGFGMVEQLDTESFARYRTPGLHGPSAAFSEVEATHFSPPTLTRTWFHQGPLGEAEGVWAEADYSREFWSGDPPQLARPASVIALLRGLPRRARRDALRALRGRILRTELFALDGTTLQSRPYTVTESRYGLREEAAPRPGDEERLRVFFPHVRTQRVTQWERGSEPLTQFSYTDAHDAYGQPRSQINVAVPRRRAAALEPYLATHTRTDYAQRDDDTHYLVDRVARTTRLEIANDGSTPVEALREQIELEVVDGRTVLGRRLLGQSVHFYDGPAFQGLGFEQLGEYGALVRTETLAFTEGILHDAYRSGAAVLQSPEVPPYLAPGAPSAWTAEYPQGFRASLGALAGYTRHPVIPGSPYAGGYYAPTARSCFDFQDNPAGPHRGLMVATRTPLGNETRIAYDPYALLPATVTDAAGLATTAEYDYRALQPRAVTDANGNRQIFGFTPLGLPAWIAVTGRTGENLGDTPAGPSVRFDHDFLAFARSAPGAPQPVSVRTLRRVHHALDPDVPPGELDNTLEAVEYSDGFGRLLQSRTLGEDTRFGGLLFGNDTLPADPGELPGTAADVVGRRRAPGDPANVVVSGWQIYDNKGRPVEKYEPFFSTGWSYLPPGGAERGERVTMYYDPRGQVVRTVNPDGSERRVIYGVPVDLAAPERFTPTPWELYTYDENDNAGRTHLAAAQPYRHHWDTPSSSVLDALGRTVETTERDRAPSAPRDPLPPVEEHRTRFRYDLPGNLVEVLDPLDRPVYRHVYDLANRSLRTESLDAGTLRIVFDAAGLEVERRDARGALVLQACDSLQRPVRLWARDAAGEAVTLRERLDYGDGGDPAQPPAERELNRSLNRLGRRFRQRDEAGRITYEAYDFKGNLREKVREVVRDEVILSAFAGPPPGWQVTAFRVDWEPPPGATLAEHTAALLDATQYRTSFTYDALNRVRALRYPRDVSGARRALRPHFSRAGALEQVELDGAPFLERIAYNARGQRVLVAYGNGVMTRYAYHPRTFDPARQRSERFSRPGPLTYQPAGGVLQDLAYRYDLSDNLLRLEDRSPGSGIPNNPDAALTADPLLAPLLASGDALVRRFRYDPLYRLRAATGRECDLPPDRAPWDDAPRCVDLTRVRAYTEQYRYDPAGNLEQLRHLAVAGGFTRVAGLAPGGNRLATLTIGNRFVRQHAYASDASGNLLREGSERQLEWDHLGRLRTFRIQPGAAEPSVHAHYLYAASGERTQKLVRRQGGDYEVTVYIDGIFEHHRRVGAAGPGANDTLHVMDNTQRVATVRVGAPFPDDGTPAVQYHLGDHLGSSHVVVDQVGAWVQREEYTPYGETSFGHFARKRYRFTGKERDEESGLYYHGARYFAPWLGRWVSPDPAGLADGTNPYRYTRSNPLVLTDRSGMQGDTPTTEEVVSRFSGPIVRTDLTVEHISVAKRAAKFQSSEVKDFGITEGFLQFLDENEALAVDDYTTGFKDHFVYALRGAILDAAQRYDLPAELIAATAHNERGGWEGVKPAVYVSRWANPLANESLEHGWATVFTDRRLTSFGPLGVQVRRAAESLGYDPAELSQEQEFALIDSLFDPAISIYVAAKHLSDLRDIDFKGKGAADLSREDVRVIFTRYRYLPERSKDHILQRLENADWSRMTAVLTTTTAVPQAQFNLRGGSAFSQENIDRAFRFSGEALRGLNPFR